MKIQLALEWFLNPDHLPLIAGIDQGWFAEAGLDVEFIIPEDHYDGLTAVAAGDIALACNEPLHMIDEPRPCLRALGCFFETDGGILLTGQGIKRLSNGQTIRLASPVAGGVTGTIAIEILKRWFEQQSSPIRPEQIAIESAGFQHLDNIRAGFDGAWLCFANFEGVEARHTDIETRFITTREVGLENFSALELFTGQDFLTRHPDVIETICDLISRGAEYCRHNVGLAADIWYRYSAGPREALMDAIIVDTCPRLVSPLVRNVEKWRPMWRQFDQLGHSAVDHAGFEALYS